MSIQNHKPVLQLMPTSASPAKEQVTSLKSSLSFFQGHHSYSVSGGVGKLFKSFSSVDMLHCYGVPEKSGEATAHNVEVDSGGI